MLLICSSNRPSHFQNPKCSTGMRDCDKKSHSPLHVQRHGGCTNILAPTNIQSSWSHLGYQFKKSMEQRWIYEWNTPCLNVFLSPSSSDSHKAQREMNSPAPHRTHKIVPLYFWRLLVPWGQSSPTKAREDYIADSLLNLNYSVHTTSHRLGDVGERSVLSLILINENCVG